MTQQLDVRNEGFDEPFEYQGGIKQLKVAKGWRVLWTPGPNSHLGFLVRPECYPKVLSSGDLCQGIQTTNATHQAAFVQAIALPLEARNLTLEARVAYHAPTGGMAVRAGLDPTGQVTDPQADSIQWGKWLNQDGDPPWEMTEWTVAKAALSGTYGGYVSIWLASQNRWRGRDNHVFWRDVSVYMDDGDQEPDPGTAAEKIMKAVDLLLEAVALL